MDPGDANEVLSAWVALPGADLVRKGLRDLNLGQESNESLLVEIGASRLRQLGVEMVSSRRESPAHRLFLRLAEEDPRRAHSRYNALLRRLASFHHSARCVR